LGSVALVTVITLVSFRLLTRSLGLKQLVEEGIVLTEDGVELPRFLWMGKMKVSYTDVETVELLPWYKGLISILLFRYGFSVRSICTRFFHEIVVIKLKGARVFEYLLVTPKNAQAFVEQLKFRMKQSRASLNETV